MGRSGGRASRVTPPIIMPVRSFVSSAVAKETRETSRRGRTVWLTSSRFVASTRHAQYFFGSFFEATMMVLPEWSSGTPYFSQKAAVSAKSGSIRMTSQVAPRPSRAAATFASISASSLMTGSRDGARSGLGGSGLDLDEAGVVGRGAAGARQVLGEHVGAAPRVGARWTGGEPGAFLDRDHPAGDAVRHTRRHHGGAAIVEHADRLAVGDAARRGVLRVNPHVLLVHPGQ